MKRTRSTSVAELQTCGRFEELRKTLLEPRYAEHLAKPLAYWAQPTDRRLPLALLGRRLGDVLHTAFADLSRTPGVGQKKLVSLLKLLARAAETRPGELPSAVAHAVAEPRVEKPAEGNGFDFGDVSEVVWDRWRTSVVRHGLGGEPLGRLAPTLRELTHVIWDRTLGEYARLSLAEIRRRKTHGEKRVRAILAVFYGVHNLVAGMAPQPHLAVRLAPRLIDGVEQWVGRTLQTASLPGEQDIFENFVRPILEQIRMDAEEPVVRLAESRLGVSGPITSVRQAARNMGLTRARVYQLLNEINDILTVRWPQGRRQVYALLAKFRGDAAQSRRPPDLRQFEAAVELFYPHSRRGAAGPLDQAGAEDDDEAESPEIASHATLVEVG
jgi:hypothetical protein